MTPTSTSTANGNLPSNGTYESKKQHWILGAMYDEVMPHHSGIRALWETKWRFPCTKSLYPFHDGKYEDFEPIFTHLIENNINDGYGDEYTKAFFPIAENLMSDGDAAVASGDIVLSSELYLRAACIYRIARFPYISSFPKISSEVKWQAWEAQKTVYMKAASRWELPVEEIQIKHTSAQGADRPTIPLYVRLPVESRIKQKVPAVLLMTGLDGYRPDNTTRIDEFVKRGWAAVVAEIPGTADCPADPADPASPDRLWTSVLDWMEATDQFDMSSILVWGLSCGGYYAVRIAHTHKERLRGVVAQGAGVHYFFGKEWLQKAEGHEYPFPLAPAMSTKLGYTSEDEFWDDAQRKFSLLETGVIQKASTRLLLVNGVQDGLMPIEDSMLLFEYGTPKEARFFQKALHMGYPLANTCVYPWMENVLAA